MASGLTLQRGTSGRDAPVLLSNLNRRQGSFNRSIRDVKARQIKRTVTIPIYIQIF